jgi:hypothetical protein
LTNLVPAELTMLRLGEIPPSDVDEHSIVGGTDCDSVLQVAISFPSQVHTSGGRKEVRDSHRTYIFAVP